MIRFAPSRPRSRVGAFSKARGEPLFVRCERCRAVYVLAVEATDPPVVRCSRCDQLFIAREPLRHLSVRGTIGGAADPASKHPPEPLADGALFASVPHAGRAIPAAPGRRGAAAAVRLATREPPGEERRNGRVVLVAALVALFAIGAFVAWKVGPFGRPQLPPAALAELTKAKAALLLDDEVDLETAMTTFDELAAKHPDRPRFLAARAFATALLGATYRTEAADLNAELTRLDREVYTAHLAAQPDMLDLVAAAKQEQQDLRARLGPVSARGDKLLHEALEKAKQALVADAGAADAIRARMLVAAATNEPNAVTSLAHTLDDTDAWAEYARGLARLQGDVTPAKAKAAQPYFEAALAKRPQLVRATWELGRAAVYEKDYPRAKRLFQAVLAKSPHHEGAQRGLALVTNLLAPPPVVLPASAPATAAAKP